jgi:hypothetical protein
LLGSRRWSGRAGAAVSRDVAGGGPSEQLGLVWPEQEVPKPEWADQEAPEQEVIGQGERRNESTSVSLPASEKAGEARS